MNDFAARLKKCRESQNLSQVELEKLAHLPATAIAHFENGSRKPSFENISKLVRALGVTADYLLGICSDTGTQSEHLITRHVGSNKGDLRLLEDFAKILAHHCTYVWILTEAINEHDQYGEYFLAVYKEKPSPDQLLKHVSKEQLAHVLENGGGRQGYEGQWFFLRQTALE